MLRTTLAHTSCLKKFSKTLSWATVKKNLVRNYGESESLSDQSLLLVFYYSNDMYLGCVVRICNKKQSFGAVCKNCSGTHFNRFRAKVSVSLLGVKNFYLA